MFKVEGSRLGCKFYPKKQEPESRKLMSTAIMQKCYPVTIISCPSIEKEANAL